jgi:LmbE family N-acetylglucosaminyl deacetylase
MSPTVRIALVSAHPDDIALSLGGLVRRLGDASLVLVTCFTASCTRDRSDATETTRARAAEDAAYARHIGAQFLQLPFADTSIRGARGTITLDAAAEADLQRTLRSALAAAIRESGADVVFAPLAIGEHADHIHCRDAVLACCSAGVVLYEDLPYAQLEGGPDRAHELVAARVPRLEPVVLPLTASEIAFKLGGLDLYPSQIHPTWRQAVQDYASVLAGGRRFAERVWLPLPAPHRSNDAYADHLHSLRRQ